jgi:Xaa-Pro aminopeptidase
MRRPNFDVNMFVERRKQLATLAQGSVIIIPAHPEYIRNHDVHFPYRQDSNLFYLTGFEEPESVLVIRPGQTPETILFVRPKDVLKETWDGFRYGPEATEREFKIDRAYLISEFERVIVDLIKPVDRVYYRWNINPAWDGKLLKILDEARAGVGRTGRGHLPVFDSWDLIGELRLFKSPEEADLMRKACDISARAHVNAMKFVKPGVNERQVQGLLLGSFFMQGADREGYGTIVAAGSNATTLHYIFNDQECKDGDLLLIDAGAERSYYTGDITRTFPINGKFSAAQKRVYEGVLQIQNEIIANIKPGKLFKSMQERTIEFLTDFMIELGLLKGSRSALIEEFAYKKYYPHGVGHWLGMDVHDVGAHLLRGEPRRLESGMVFTVEPGLYIPADDLDAPAELRGIGIRIEDNILVNEVSCEVMTSLAPKEIAEMEAIIGTESH